MQILINELTKNKELIEKSNNTIRLFHGRGKCFIGFEQVIIDFYDPYILVDCYQPIKNLKDILATVDNLFPNIQGIFYRFRKDKPIRCQSFKGDIPEKHFAIWNGLKFEIDFCSNQNVGYFLDAENIRLLIQENAKNKDVLNLFAYTCSLSVIAKSYGAKSVCNVDMNKGVLKIGQRSHAINNIESSNTSFLSYNIMRSLRGLENKGKWDLIIVDPPSFQGKSFNLNKDYETIIKNISNLAKEKCDLVLCINSPFVKSDFIINLKEKYLPNYRLSSIFYSPETFIELNKEDGVKIIHLSNSK